MNYCVDQDDQENTESFGRDRTHEADKLFHRSKISRFQNSSWRFDLVFRKGRRNNNDTFIAFRWNKILLIISNLMWEFPLNRIFGEREKTTHDKPRDLQALRMHVLPTFQWFFPFRPVVFPFQTIKLVFSYADL